MASVIAPAFALADPLAELARGRGDACFRRIYDAAHLARIPRQQTTSMTMWIVADKQSGIALGLALTQRRDPEPVYLSGNCEWEQYRRGQKSWMDIYKKRAGGGCITLAVPDVFEASSAEEGGGVILDPAPDGNSVMVYLDDGQTMVKRAARGRKIDVRLGADDRVFLLRRTDIRDCDSVKEAVTTPEPGVRR